MHPDGLRRRAAYFPRPAFRRIAAVLVLPDAELFRRQGEQHAREGKTVPEPVILQMRGAVRPCRDCSSSSAALDTSVLIPFVIKHRTSDSQNCIQTQSAVAAPGSGTSLGQPQHHESAKMESSS